MKTHLKLLTGIAFLLSACTTGTMVSSRGYTDDVYFTPGDTPPPVTINSQRRGTDNEPSVSSKSSQEKAARVVDEYFDQNQDRSNTYSYNNDNSSAADTLYEGEEYEMDIEDEDIELSYSTRLRTFYNPYMYDPFWDSYMGWNMGWGYGFGGMYAGWYSPWSYRGWYDPFYSYSWGYPYYGGYGYYGGYYGGYHGGYWDGYYGGGYYGGGGHGDGWHGKDRYYGRQNLAGNYGRRSNAVSYGSNASLRSSTIRGNNDNSTFTGRRGATATSPNSSSRQAGTRYTVDPNASTRSARISQQGGQRNNETLMNLRRSGTRQGLTSPATRSSSVSQDNNSQRYTPTYSRPRTNTQATYNSGTREYSRPQYRSSESSRYSKPGSYSAAPSRSSSYSTGESGATYQRRSATVSGDNSGGRTYSAPSYSAPSRSSSDSYSAPRSSSSGSYSGGGGSYSGGGGGSHSGGGGGDGGGRRR